MTILRTGYPQAFDMTAANQQFHTAQRDLSQINQRYAMMEAQMKQQSMQSLTQNLHQFGESMRNYALRSRGLDIDEKEAASRQQRYAQNAWKDAWETYEGTGYTPDELQEQIRLHGAEAVFDKISTYRAKQARIVQEAREKPQRDRNAQKAGFFDHEDMVRKTQAAGTLFAAQMEQADKRHKIQQIDERGLERRFSDKDRELWSKYDNDVQQITKAVEDGGILPHVAQPAIAAIRAKQARIQPTLAPKKEEPEPITRPAPEGVGGSLIYDGKGGWNHIKAQAEDEKGQTTPIGPPGAQVPVKQPVLIDFANGIFKARTTTNPDTGITHAPSKEEVLAEIYFYASGGKEMPKPTDAFQFSGLMDAAAPYTAGGMQAPVPIQQQRMWQPGQAPTTQPGPTAAATAAAQAPRPATTQPAAMAPTGRKALLDELLKLTKTPKHKMTPADLRRLTEVRQALGY